MSGGFVRRAVGSTVGFRIKTVQRKDDSTDGDPVAVNGVSVTITDPSGAVIAANASLEAQSTGIYVYRWNTSGLVIGTYKLVFTTVTSTSGTEVKDDIRVELTR